jgi:hypothetical protein
MKRILKEPLLRFLLLGAAIFVAYSLVSKVSSGEPRKIVVTQGQRLEGRVAALADVHDAVRREWDEAIGLKRTTSFTVSCSSITP